MADNRALLRGYLKDRGFEFIEAADGRRAVDLARSRRPDLILMDIKMPGMDGREAAGILKAGDATKEIPIIAVTASVMKDAEEAIRGPCDGYLRKPVKKDDVLGELKRFLKYSVEAPRPSDSDRPESENEFETDALDPGALERLPGLTTLLKTSFTPRWEEINDMLIMDDVRQFTADLAFAAREYGLHFLVDFCAGLQENIERYDVIGVKNRMARFPGLIERIEQLGNEEK